MSQREMPGLLPGQLRGLMMDRPLLVAPLLRFAAHLHADTAVFFDVTFADAIKRLAGKVPSVRAFVGLGDAGCIAKLDPAIGAKSYEELLAAAPDGFSFPEFDENAAASLCYTSGTTGNP